MPTYCYKINEDLKFDRDFPAGEAPDEIPFLRIPSVSKELFTAYRDRQTEALGMTTSVKNSDNPVKSGRVSPWPMEPCIASGVHPDQAQELRGHLEKHGCKTEVNKEGNPIYTSASHRKRALKCRGLNDRNSYT